MKTMRPSGTAIGCLTLLAVFLVCATVPAQLAPVPVWQSRATNTYISNHLAVSPDGQLVASLGTNNSIQIWSMSDGAPLIALSGHRSWIGDLAFSPDGTLLASGSGDSSVRVWRTSDWSLAYSVASASQGPPVAFSPDSGTLALGTGKTIELRRAADGTLIHSWTATTGEMRALAFSPDGTRLASGAGFRGIDTALKIWESPSGALLRSVPTAQTYGIGHVAFSPDGLQVVTGSEFLSSGPMQSWRVSDGALLKTFPLAAFSMSFSADGSVMGAVGANIFFFRAADGVLIQEYADGFTNFTQGEKGIAFAPSGSFVRSRGNGEVLAGRVPVLVSTPSLQGGQMNLRWVGGTGRYALQRVPVIGGEWQDEGGILTSNSVTFTPGSPSGFFRVVDVP